MALVAPPAHDRKRVKVYELKNNDWFDRGTGFCRGVVLSVRLGPPPCCCAPMLTCDRSRRKPRLSSSPKTTRRASCSRLASPRTMATRNSRVCPRDRIAASLANARQILSSCGPRGMAPTWRSASRSPRDAPIYGMLLQPGHQANALIMGRDFVNEVQSRLQQLAQGMSPSNHHPRS